MEAPFIYGKLAKDKYFTNRKEEIGQLVFNFTSLINTILISPRRWGKSSLVSMAAEIAIKQDNSLKVCFIDLYNIRNEGQFYQLLAQEILRISSSKMEGIIENVKKFMGIFIPKISFSPDTNSEFSLSLDWKEVIKKPDDILDMAEKIATEKKYKFVICIDEFQNIAGFENPLLFQKKLRAHWQQHKNTCYCLYGSKRYMLMDVFSSPSMPFYKFGDILFLQKIEEKDWIPFIMKRFSVTRKEIGREEARLLANLVECHPYYLQQLAQQAWLRTNKKCSKDTVLEAFDNLILQLSLLFQTLTDELSNTQLNFLKAVLQGIKQLSAKNILQEFQLGTSANIQRIKKSLINKEIIEIKGKKIYFLDPVYKCWLKEYYFKV